MLAQLGNRRQRVVQYTGFFLLASSLAGDGWIGWRILQGGTPAWLLLHCGCILLGVQGLSLTRHRDFCGEWARWGLLIIHAHPRSTAERPRFPLAVWLVFCLGMVAFPGFGLIACALAAVFLWQPKHAVAADQMAATQAPLTNPPPVRTARDILPLVHALRSPDIETRRSAIGTLGRHSSPAMTQALRDLLADPVMEIRHDASVTLTRLEEALASPITTTLAQWERDPSDSVVALVLARQCYTYAASNVLEHSSQMPYLKRARVLLEDVLTRAPAHCEALFLLAQICQRMGAFPAALTYACQALAAQPTDKDCWLLALNYACLAHDWGTLIRLAQRYESRFAPGAAEAALLQRWTAIPVTEGVWHG